MRLTIAVATYLRGPQLGRLLESIAGLDLSAVVHDSLSVLVVDNDPLGSALPVFERYAPKLAVPSRYVVEPRAGHVHARNRAVGEVAAHGSEFVLFVDDDEIVPSTWVNDMLATQAKYRADFVCGAVRSVFEVEPPRWVEESGAFRRRRMATGTPMTEFNAGNLLARVSAMRSHSEEPFDPRLALVGGEDSLLSSIMTARGYIIVWCDEGVVDEVVPPSRCTVRYVARRRLRVGTTGAYVRMQNEPTARRPLIRASLVVRNISVGIVRLASGGAALLAGRRADAYRSAFSAVNHWGQAIGYLGRLVEEYRRDD